MRLPLGPRVFPDPEGMLTRLKAKAAPAAARRVAERLLREQPALTGVVVHNEAVLEPLIDAFEQLGLQVPGDMSVTAICPDGLASGIRVPVTSVALPSEEVGERAVDLLMRKLGGETVPGSTCCHRR